LSGRRSSVFLSEAAGGLTWVTSFFRAAFPAFGCFDILVLTSDALAVDFEPPLQQLWQHAEPPE
jgi:hypothetical protein